jgi:hypothetical protein
MLRIRRQRIGLPRVSTGSRLSMSADAAILAA